MKTAYLTIDDGPSPDMKDKVDFLVERQIPAVWFCIGEAMLKRPEPVLYAIKRGFVIGNHSFSHPHFSTLSLRQIDYQLRTTDRLIDALYLRADCPRTHRYFRFPYGDKGDGRYGRVFDPINSRGQQRTTQIQHLLDDLGYGQPAFPNVSYPFMHQHGLLRNRDWHWTLDLMEWVLLTPTNGISTVADVQHRLRQLRPFDCRGALPQTARWGLPSPDSDEIILIHDQAPTTSFFYELITTLITLGVRFESVWS